MKKILIFLVALSSFVIDDAQSVGIGTDTPESSAILDIKATDKGILIPRVSTSARNAIAVPAKGLMVYDTTVSRFYYFTGSVWTEVGNVFGSWSLNGNTGAVNAVLGTNDANNLFFRVNGAKSGAILWGAQASTCFGYLSAPNFSGSGTSAFGHLALNSLTTGNDNTAIGINTLKITTTGSENTALGSAALLLNSSGIQNTGLGNGALANNTTTGQNTGVGYRTLFNTATSANNVAVGAYAGALKNNGYNNVFVGAYSDVNGTGYFNVIAIGEGTIGTASSQVTIGNSSSNSYRVYANWSNISDGRFKKNIREDVQGLAFINSLRPVTYNLDATGVDQFLHRNVAANNPMSPVATAAYKKSMEEKEQMRVTGFVAQEVEQVAHGLGFDFSGVDAPKNANDLYGLRYSDFVVPLVKAVQEQQAIINHQKSDIDELKREVELLTKKVDALAVK